MLAVSLMGLSITATRTLQRWRRPGSSFGNALGAALCLHSGKVKPPTAKKVFSTIYFGNHPERPEEDRGPNPMVPPMKHEDPYFWMRDDDRKHPEVISHLEAENAYCAAGMAHLKDQQATLYNEMIAHMKETDEDVPYIRNNFQYYSRNVKGLAYKIHCRKALAEKGQPEGAEEVVLDENEVAKGHEQSVVACLEMSPCHRFVAYAVDHSGYETYTIKILNVATRAYLPDCIEDTDGTIEWGPDGAVFYLKQDDAHRPHELWIHSVSSLSANTDLVQEDVLLKREDDALFWMGIGKTQDDRYLVCGTDSSETSEQHLLDLDLEHFPETLAKVPAAFVTVSKREFGLRYDIEHHEGTLLIVTNKDKAKSNKLCMAHIHKPTTLAADVQKSHWKDVKAYDASIQIGHVIPFKKHVVIFGRQHGLLQIWIVNATKGLGEWKRMAFPEANYGVWSKDNYEYNSHQLRLVYSSFTTPRQTMDYDMTTDQRKVLKQQEVPGYDASLYSTRRMFVSARDGVNVPISLVAKTSVFAAIDSGNSLGHKLLLDAYGSYGHAIDTNFSFTRLSLLDRDFVYCVAHIRGGGEMGKQWHEDEGKYLKKLNTFNDFADCAKYLIKNKYTTSDQLGITGRSAGGLLMGAVVNREPNLYKACVAAVPFVDVMCTMCDPSIPLTIAEWEEWGNPNEEKYYAYMKGYSPIDNVCAQRYPSMLITGGLNDPRVAYWEPAKWVAKLRELKTNSDEENPLFFKTDMETGHFSASDRYKHIKETAFEYSFLIEQLAGAGKKEVAGELKV
jgi:oligopeptidase B